jgi:hypothetical protein
MDEKEYLNELAFILESAEPSYGEHFIRIDAISAKDIAHKLRYIASKLPSILH